MVTGAVITFGGTPGTYRSVLDSEISTTRFHHAEVMCSDPSNPDGCFIGDHTSVRCFDGHQTVSLLAGYQTSGFSDGFGSTARFDRVGSLCCTRDRKRMFVVDTNNHSLRLISIEERAVSSLLHKPKPQFAAKGSGASSPPFFYPDRVLFDRSPSIQPESSLYIAATELHRFDIKTGAITTVPVSLATMRRVAIECLSNGILLLVSQAVSTFNPRTKQLLKLVGAGPQPTGKFGFGFGDGVGDAVQFDDPQSVVVVEREHCAYVADTSHNRIRRITLPLKLFN